MKKSHMNESRDQQRREIVWRRPLQPAELAEPAGRPVASPDQAVDWQEENRLTLALAQLPNLPVANNFTARVLAAVEREDAHVRPVATPWANWITARVWRWLAPTAAVALILAGVGLAWQWRQATTRATLARDIAAMSRVSELAPPEVFAEFEIINRLGGPPLPDEELLAVMQ